MNNELIEAIMLVADKYVKNAPYNYLVEGVIADADNKEHIYTVTINDIDYENIKPVDSGAIYSIGDIVYVIIVNNNFSRKLILGKNGNKIGKKGLDYQNLPTDPVRIYRVGGDPKGKAYRFDYAFEGYPAEYEWSQVLHRRDDGKVYMITNHYSDGTTLYYYLKRNIADRVEYYGQNDFWKP